MNYWKVREGVLIASILAFSFYPTAKAQEQSPATTAQVQTPANAVATSSTTIPAAPSADRWEFQSLSYLWFPGINGTVGARGYEASTHVSPSDLVGYLNVGIMGSFEAHYNRWGVPFDFVWARLGDNKTFTNLPGYTAKPTVKQVFLTPKVTYLLVDGRRVKIKATAGLRYWHLGENLKIVPPTGPSVSFGVSQNWVDAVGGANIVVPFSSRIAMMVLGDAGRGGANVDYQVAGLVNYQIKPKWGIGLGYRYVDVSYRNSNQVIFDTAQSGIALTLLYKYGKQPPVQ